MKCMNCKADTNRIVLIDADTDYTLGVFDIVDTTTGELSRDSQDRLYGAMDKHPEAIRIVECRPCGRIRQAEYDRELETEIQW